MAATLTVPPTRQPARDRSHRPAPRPVSGAGRERVYRRRRWLLGGVTAVLVTVVMVAVPDLLTGGGAPAGAVTGIGAGRARTVVAHSGDTLWSIAGEHRGGVPIGRYVDALVDLNGGPSILAGQTVKLP